MMGLSVVALQMLAKIASGEAHDYNTIYGGHKFSSYDDHPRVEISLGHGQYSSAAGKYQLLAPTWDDERKRLGLTDFSPKSQDFAAWDLAQRTYQQKTGRNLEDDGARGDVNWEALANQWPSLRRGAPAQVQVSRPKVAPMGPAPSLQNPPEMEALLRSGSPLAPRPKSPQGAQIGPLQALFPEVPLTPIDHNPFQSAQLLSPVEHDPFQQENSQP